MDRAVHTAAAEQGLVGRVHNRAHLLLGDVADQHANPPIEEINHCSTEQLSVTLFSPALHTRRSVAGFGATLRLLRRKRGAQNLGARLVRRRRARRSSPVSFSAKIKFQVGSSVSCASVSCAASRGSTVISSNISWRRKASATPRALCSVRGRSGSVLAISNNSSSSISMPSAPSTTPGTISISFRLWMRKRPGSSTHSSMNGSRSACSASDCDRYAPSTIRQYSRPLLVFITPDPEACACADELNASTFARRGTGCATLYHRTTVRGKIIFRWE